jgi:hypothetical protein
MAEMRGVKTAAEKSYALCFARRVRHALIVMGHGGAIAA